MLKLLFWLIIPLLLLPGISLAVGTFEQGLLDAADKATADEIGLSKISFPELYNQIAIAIETMIGIVAIVALMIAGLKYVLALGDEARSAAAKRTIFTSILGIILVGMARAIRQTIRELLATKDVGEIPEVAPYVDLILGIALLIMAPAGVIAFAVLIYGGYLYLTSVGDEARTGRAKKLIFFAIIGLMIIGISGITVNAVIQLIPVI